jgi:hypothetical protein
MDVRSHDKNFTIRLLRPLSARKSLFAGRITGSLLMLKSAGYSAIIAIQLAKTINAWLIAPAQPYLHPLVPMPRNPATAASLA